MLGEVRARLGGDPRLAGRVHLLGRVPHAQVETLLRASDLYVSGSRAEGSGYAAIEAMACGVTPVLTDIPAFRALTDDGRIGRLWPCGDAQRLAEALLLEATKPTSPERVRAHFDARLSFDAVGRLWETVISAEGAESDFTAAIKPIEKKAGVVVGGKAGGLAGK